MDFSELVDSKIQCTGRVSKIINNDRNGLDMIVIEDVFVNGSYFRDHCWIKITKRLRHIKIGDNISFTAIIKEYPGVEVKIKYGFSHIRNIVAL